MGEVTGILDAIVGGEPQAAEQLLPLVYNELHRLAVQKMAGEAPGQTLQATALVHEAYLRLVDADRPQTWNGRGHFFAAAAEAMRRILVENARHKASLKRGGTARRVDLDETVSFSPDHPEDLIALSDALDRLSAEDPVKADVVKLRYFAGLSVQETADALNISRATADRYWAYARAWLYCALSGQTPLTGR
jgi:RNA polymerase sigma factor (TIGR02999 family)